MFSVCIRGEEDAAFTVSMDLSTKNDVIIVRMTSDDLYY